MIGPEAESKLGNQTGSTGLNAESTGEDQTGSKGQEPESRVVYWIEAGDQCGTQDRRVQG